MTPADLLDLLEHPGMRGASLALPDGEAREELRFALRTLLRSHEVGDRNASASSRDLTPKAVGQLLGVSGHTVASLARAGELPGAYRLSTRGWRIPLTAVDAFRANRQREDADETVEDALAEMAEVRVR